MCETQPQEVWRSSLDLISVRTDKQEPSFRSSGISKQISKMGAAQYLHSHETGDGGRERLRCSSMVVQRVEAPVSVVWSLVRRFDEPQIYKNFVRDCFMRGEGDLKVKVGCHREIHVVSGLPGATSTERLDILDEEQHILSFSIVGGDHRLNNYRSITHLQETLIDGKPGTMVIESYVVDVPQGNTKEETCLFVETIVKCNLQSLAHVSKHLCSSTHGY